MIKSSAKFNSQILPCRLSWLLVEVSEDDKIEYFVIHSVEVNGDCSRAYANRKVIFTQGRRELTGLVRLASDDLKAVEKERTRLMLAQRSISTEPDPLKTNLWCLVRQIDNKNWVRLVIVNYKYLIPYESADMNRKHFLMQRNDTEVSVELLRISNSEHKIISELEFLKDTIAQTCLCEEKDQNLEPDAIQEAFLLLQYFEDRSNLIYTIVPYKDTIFKKENLFQNVVAYILNDDEKTISQCIILKKSFEKDELAKLLPDIWKTCDSII